MDEKQRHIEVIMKGFALCLTGVALLAAGCAQNRNSDPEIAPSRQASRLTSGSGWSVPPGQNRVTDTAAPREALQDNRALSAGSENTREAAAISGPTARRDPDPRRDANHPAKTARRESDPGRDPFSPRMAGGKSLETQPTLDTGPRPASVTGRRRTAEPRNLARAGAGKGEAAGGIADYREVEPPIGAKSRAARIAPVAVRMPPAKSPGRERAADTVRPARMNTGRTLSESAARADGQFRRSSRASVTARPPIRRIKPLVFATPVRAVSKEAQPLRTVFFQFDSNVLSAEAERVLEANARWLLDRPKVRVRVEGHADERGTSEYNLTLGERRARKVRDFLISRGVSPENLLTVSFGEELPLETGSDPKSWGINRRAEFGLITGGNMAAMTTGRQLRRSNR